MATRWFLVPIVGTGTHGDEYRPKYSDEAGIEGTSGQQVTVNGSDYYVAKFKGSTSALDTIEGYSDATSINEAGLSKSDVAAGLNERFGYSYTFSEWGQRFLSQ